MLLVLAMKCYTKMPCPLPHNHLLLTFFTYMLASPAHLYMPHLFTHSLPTIICVMLMSIAFFFNFLLYATFCDSILDCLCISWNILSVFVFELQALLLMCSKFE